ncbi:MAG: hypothetical protein KDB03_05510 [Planctomycetales bacterium]|nr:hypothetical protein [Planctomycetales bacterium]
MNNLEKLTEDSHIDNHRLLVSSYAGFQGPIFLSEQLSDLIDNNAVHQAGTRCCPAG